MRDFLGKWKKHFVFVALLSCFINILQLTFAFYMFTIYRNIVVSHHEPSLYTITVIALYALVALGFFNYLRIRLLSRAGVDLDQTLGESVFANILRGAAAPGRNQYTHGMADIATLKGYFNNPGLYALFDAPWAPLYLLLIYFFHATLGIVATIGAVVIFCLSLLQDYLTRERFGAANMQNSRNQKMVQTALRNAEVINSMGMADDICNRWSQANAGVITNQTIASRYAGAIQSVTRPLQVSLQVFIYGIGAYYVMLGQLDVGLMVAGAIIMGQAVGPVMRVMGAWRFTLQAGSAYDRLSRFLAIVERQPAKMSLPKPVGQIDARQLFLKIGQSIVLRNVSFALKPGELMGVIGPSGAGKSTLCRIITGVWPAQAGEIRLDNVDLFYWDQEQLGRYVGYLSQDVALFDASVEKNIARMGPVDDARDQEAVREAVREAARAVNIHTWIESLPQGYQTRLGSSGGITLSGGQRQRIGIARAIYGNPKVLILDEPNANLDTDAEKAFIELLADIKRQRSSTCIIVTHKPEILDAVDRILMLKEGQVAAFGPRDDVFKLIGSHTPHQQVG